MTEMNYGLNVENLLYDLSQHESDDIGEFDFYCEDEHGREGSATIDITLLAADAHKLIAELKAQRDSLAAENAEVRASIPEERFIDILNENMDDVSLAEDIGYNTAVKEMRRDIETPATDAYLNSVRAEGVDMFISELAELFKTLKAGGKPWQAVKGIAMRAASFAAQLRAGKDGE